MLLPKFSLKQTIYFVIFILGRMSKLSASQIVESKRSLQMQKLLRKKWRKRRRRSIVLLFRKPWGFGKRWLNLLRMIHMQVHCWNSKRYANHFQSLLHVSKPQIWTLRINLWGHGRIKSCIYGVEPPTLLNRLMESWKNIWGIVWEIWNLVGMK